MREVLRCLDLVFDSFLKDFKRSPIVQGLMGSLGVVKAKPILDSVSSLSGRGIFIEIDFFPFEASPEPFSEDVVDRPSFSIHTDLDVSGTETIEIAVAGEMRSLVTVENGRRRGRKGPIHRLEDKRHSKV